MNRPAYRSRLPDIDREPTRFLRIKTQHTYRLCSLGTRAVKK